MPELRSGVRRRHGRAPVVDRKDTTCPAEAAAVVTPKRSEHLVGNYIKTRAAAAKEAAAAVVGTTAVVAETKVNKSTKRVTRRQKKEAAVVEEEAAPVAEPPLIVISEGKEKEGGKKKNLEMADGSGGLSANKATQEEEGNTAPFPERVLSLFSVCVWINCFMLTCLWKSSNIIDSWL